MAQVPTLAQGSEGYQAVQGAEAAGWWAENKWVVIIGGGITVTMIALFMYRKELGTALDTVSATANPVTMVSGLVGALPGLGSSGSSGMGFGGLPGLGSLPGLDSLPGLGSLPGFGGGGGGGGGFGALPGLPGIPDSLSDVLDPFDIF